MCFIFPLISFWERRRTAPLKAKSLNPRETFFYSPIQLRWLSGKNRKEEKDKKRTFWPVQRRNECQCRPHVCVSFLRERCYVSTATHKHHCSFFCCIVLYTSVESGRRATSAAVQTRLMPPPVLVLLHARDRRRCRRGQQASEGQ